MKTEKKGLRASIHGSRSLADERVKLLLMEEINRRGITHIVTHAEPGGVCQVARKLCRELAMPLTLHFLNFKYLRGAFERRSKAVISDCDIAICIHDGKSQGTKNEIKLTKKMKVFSVVHELTESCHKQSVGFDIDEEWDVDKAPEKGLQPFIELEGAELDG